MLGTLSSSVRAAPEGLGKHGSTAPGMADSGRTKRRMFFSCLSHAILSWLLLEVLGFWVPAS